MGLKFYDYDGLQPKISPPKHFSRQCNIAQPIQPISTQIGLDWLYYYLAGNSQMAPTIFFKFSGYIFLIISLRTHKPQLPSHF